MLWSVAAMVWKLGSLKLILKLLRSGSILYETQKLQKRTWSCLKICSRIPKLWSLHALCTKIDLVDINSCTRGKLNFLDIPLCLITLGSNSQEVLQHQTWDSLWMGWGWRCGQAERDSGLGSKVSPLMASLQQGNQLMNLKVCTTKGNPWFPISLCLFMLKLHIGLGI